MHFECNLPAPVTLCEDAIAEPGIVSTIPFTNIKIGGGTAQKMVNLAAKL